MTRRSLCGFLILLCAAGGPVAAQTSEETGFLLETRYVDALQAERWREALECFRSLELRGAEFTTAQRLAAARAHRELNELGASAAILERLVEEQPEHIAVLHALARVRVRQGELGRARDLLGASARLGQCVLRDLREGVDADRFAQLLRDPAFVLHILQESKAWELRERGLRDPFSPPGRPEPPPAGGSGAEDPDPVELERRIERLFEAMLTLAEARDYQALGLRLDELRALLAQYGEQGARTVEAKLNRYRGRFAELEELQLSLLLQVWISSGNRHLRAMAEALEETDYERVFAGHAAIAELVARLEAEDRPAFRRNAQALGARARALRERALLEQRIAAFALEVTGIVLPPPGEPRRAIVNDRIVRVGDTLVDAEGSSLDLRVEGIASTVVTFSHAGVEFVRTLRARR